MRAWIPLGITNAGAWLKQHAAVGVLGLVAIGALAWWLLPAAEPILAQPTRSKPSEIAALPLQRDNQVAQTLKAQDDNEQLRSDLKEIKQGTRALTQTVASLQNEAKAKDLAWKQEKEDLLKRLAQMQPVQKTTAKTTSQAKTGPSAEEQRLRAELERLRQGQAAAAAQQHQQGQDQTFNRFEVFRVNEKHPMTYPLPPSAARADIPYLEAGCFAPISVVTGAAVSGRTDKGRPLLTSVVGPFQCPYQLQGSGARSLETELPLQGCSIFFAGGADLVDSRVLGDAQLLACVMPDLAGFEKPLKGYLVGADGNLGLPGTLETHESAAVAKAAFTAILGEAGAVFGLARSKIVVTGGYSGGPLPGQGVQSGLGELQKYFLEQARNLGPTLRASRGERGYVVVQEGVALEGLPTQIMVRGR